ncbi:Uncharacterised protein [uncultured archaeon]|nr:Uncharacterised protein [uncultured archaeon]
MRYDDELDSYDYRAMPPIIYFIWQAFFDLKASAFLALGAHYRSAIQPLRPILENIMVSRYFHEKLLHAKDETWKEEYEEFINWSESTEHKEGFGKSLKYLRTKGIITSDGEEEKWLNEEWEKLNKYLHPYMFRWDKGKTPEVVRYDEGKYNEWLDMYQSILSYMIEILCNYFPESIKSQNGQNALIELKGMESLEEDCKVTLIISKHFRNFLSQISTEGNLLYNEP